VRSVDTVAVGAVLAVALALSTSLTTQAAQSSQEIEQAVERSLRNKEEFRRIEVAVAGDEVTLRGGVPHLWAKNQAIDTTLEVEGVETVVSELMLPERVDDDRLAEQVGQIVNRYAYYTIWDYVDEIEIQSASGTDARLRAIIGRRLASNMHFDRTVRMRNPPFRIVVNNSIVTLHGWVQGEIEYREMEQIIRFTQGVLRVDNQLRVISRN
jgi:osmotically-inducible protein OsmY